MPRVVAVTQTPRVLARISTVLAERDGIELVTCATPDELLALLAQERADVLVIDGDLRPEGGYSLLHTIREQDELAGQTTPPALVLVGRPDDRWLANWAGADEALVKPVDPFLLADRVAALALRGNKPSRTRGQFGSRPLADDIPSELDHPDAPVIHGQPGRGIA